MATRCVNHPEGDHEGRPYDAINLYDAVPNLPKQKLLKCLPAGRHFNSLHLQPVVSQYVLRTYLLRIGGKLARAEQRLGHLCARIQQSLHLGIAVAFGIDA